MALASPQPTRWSIERSPRSPPAPDAPPSARPLPVDSADRNKAQTLRRSPPARRGPKLSGFCRLRLGGGSFLGPFLFLLGLLGFPARPLLLLVRHGALPSRWSLADMLPMCSDSTVEFSSGDDFGVEVFGHSG